MSKLASLEKAMESVGVMPLVEHALVGAFATKSFGKGDAEALALKVGEVVLQHLSDHVAAQPQGSGN